MTWGYGGSPGVCSNDGGQLFSMMPLSPSPKCRSLLSASVNRYFPGGVVSVVKVPG
jgi:hypothetical protein